MVEGGYIRGKWRQSYVPRGGVRKWSDDLRKWSDDYGSGAMKFTEVER